MPTTPKRSRTWRLALGFGMVALVIGAGCGTRADFIDLGPMATVRGSILDKVGNRLPGARVSLEGPRTVSELSRADGTYQIDGVLPDLYDLVASREIDGVVCRVRLRFIRLVDGQVFIAPDLQVQRPAVLTGSVTIPGRTDFSGVRVQVIGTRLATVTDAAGRFTFDEVEGGTYSINFNLEGLVSETVRDVVVPEGTTVTVDPVTIRPANPPAFAAISGQVLLESRTDHSGVVIRINGTARSAVTTSGGFFTFENLPVSRYSITFSRDEFFDRTLTDVSIVTGSSKLQLASVQLDSHQVLNESIRAFDLEWSPNGRQIAYITQATPDTAEIAVTDPTALIYNEVITQGARAVGGAGITWRPDGQELVFTRGFTGTGNTSALGITSKEGRDLRNLLPVANQYAAPVFAPDGTRLAYYLNPDLRTLTIDRSTGSTVAVTSTSAVIDTLGAITRLTGMEWTNTGRIIYSHTPMTVSEGIFTVFSTGGGRLEIIPTISPGVTIPSPESPTLRPRDFARIAFSFKDATDATPPNGLYICDLDGLNATRISTVPGNHLDWSPDGTRILFTKLSTDPALPDRITEVLVPRSLR